MGNAYFRLFSTFLIFFCFSQAAFAQDKKLPFPSFPASFEEAEYQGQKGCIAANEDTYLVMGAIASNEGTMVVGALNLIETPSVGAHAMQIHYNPVKDYAYVMANKAKGAVCIIDKLTELSFQNIGDNHVVNYTEATKYTPQKCSFTQRYGSVCGTFSQVSGALSSNGFKLDWQGKQVNGNILSLLSNDKKSYYLTSDSATGATVVTGVGDYRFEYINVPIK